MPVPIKIPNLLGGVSRDAQSARLANQFEEMDNVELSPQNGAEKRPGSEFIESTDGASNNGELTVSEPTNTKKIFWLDRASPDQFVVIVDPTVTDTDKIIQVFNISDGVERTVLGNGEKHDTASPPANAVLSDAINLDLRTYLLTGTQDVRRRYKMLAVEDATFILNRTVIAASILPSGTWQNNGAAVRSKANAQNVPAWSDFDQPPTGVDTFTDRNTRKVGGIINNTNNAFWHARDNDVGQAQGFYFAVSSAVPPWFQRFRSESQNSMIDEDTMPLRLDFDGTDFLLTPVLWEDRFSGDTTTNPGPSFLTNAISDMVLHQNRLFFFSGEQIVSSRADDLFNLWIDSIILRNDADPIDQTVPGGSDNKTNIIDFAISFQDALIILTRGSRQVEMRANGPLTPNTAFLLPSTSIQTVQYMPPVTMADKMYMMTERDFANGILEYDYDPDKFGNSADPITDHIRNYIPAESAVMVASEQHKQLFVITDADTNVIYVCKIEDEQQQDRGTGRRPPWYKWEFDSNVIIHSIQVFDDFLYMVIEKDSLLWLERIPLGIPQQDTDNANGTLQGMGYNIPIDRKHSLKGVHNTSTDETSWTLPFEDASIDELILGPSWDTDFTEGDGSITKQRLAGMRFKAGVNMIVTSLNGKTVLTTSGQFQTNISANDPLAFAGRSYKKRIRFSQQFFHDPRSGIIVQGNLQLMTAVIRHKNTGFYAFEVTPLRRDTIIQEFVVPIVGSTPLDSGVLDLFGEFQPRVFSAAHSVVMEITNDSPLPSAIIEVEFAADLVPGAKSPVK